jgi:hypothetical protein
MSANLSYGSNTIQYSAGFLSSSYLEYWRVFIDYNQNGVFETNERVVSRSSRSSGTLSSSFNVPTSALTGPTRMRVSMKYNSYQDPCETFSYGEVEDYTVIIGNNAIPQGIAGGNDFISSEISLYPNPTKHTLNIVLLNAVGKDYIMYNVMGQVVGKGIFTDSLDVSSLQNGVYMLEVNTEESKMMKRFVKE